jgi:hypothetical protein
VQEFIVGTRSTSVALQVDFSGTFATCRVWPLAWRSFSSSCPGSGPLETSVSQSNLGFDFFQAVRKVEFYGGLQSSSGLLKHHEYGAGEAVPADRPSLAL